MKKMCIFITHKFPFQTDETFIENEIEYLSKVFDSILLIAAYANPVDAQTRAVPSNVKIVKLGYSSLSLQRKIKYGMLGFLKSNTDVYQELFRVPSFGWKLNCFYFFGVVQSMYRKTVITIDENIQLGEFDSCLIYSYWLSEHALLAIKLREFCRQVIPTKAISRAHRYDVYAYRKKYRAFPFKEKMIHGLDAIFPCSEDGTNYLATQFPKYITKIQTAYLGTIDYGENPSQNSEPFTIVSCSNIVPVKRVHLIASALAKIKRNGCSDFTWICIGSGPLLEDLQRTIHTTLDLGANVQFLGRIPNNEVLELYSKKHIDLFINVSENEGLPVSIMEAQSFGIPCLATDVGGTSEIIIDEVVGKLLSETISPDELALEIMRCMDARDTWLLTQRKNARSNWLKKFNADTNYNRWIETIKKMDGRAYGRSFD